MNQKCINLYKINLSDPGGLVLHKGCYQLEKKKAGVWYRVGIGCLSFMVALVLYVSTAEVGGKKVLGLSSSTTGSFVLEDIKINYEYDRSKYEVVPYENDAYAVVSGDKTALNMMKLAGTDPVFTVDLTGKKPGKYQERVLVDGVRKDLKVEVFPGLMELRVMELQTMKLTPVIEMGEMVTANLESRGYVASLPELVDVKDVRIRDVQSRLNRVGQVRGVIKAGTTLEPGTNVTVELSVFDRDGKLMNVNLIDREVMVRVPLESKVTVVKESVVNKIVKSSEAGAKNSSEEDREKEAVDKGSVIDSSGGVTDSKETNKSETDSDKADSGVPKSDGDSEKPAKKPVKKPVTDVPSKETDKDSIKTPVKKPVKKPVNQYESDKESDKKDEGVTGTPVGTAPVPSKDPVRDPDDRTDGEIKFVKVPRGYEVVDLTSSKVTWTMDRSVDVSDFAIGKYEMVITDGGVKKTLRFEIRKIAADESEEDSSDKAGIVSEDVK